MANPSSSPGIHNFLHGASELSNDERMEITGAQTAAAYSQQELQHWMLRYQAADPDAARALIRSLSPALFRFLSSQVSTRDEAEDLLQEAWLQIHKARHTYRRGEPVLPWIYAIARHVRVDGYRRRHRIAQREVATDVLPERRTNDSIHSQLPDFEVLMSYLPDNQREVVTLLKVEGLSLEEVARVTASTVGSVKQKAHRAYKRLREILTQEQSVANTASGESA
ncbi:MAG TPA: RNA polymerase sigma factor [Bryobacteraceae bacterium]|nr:RNA polymerase sigma factor [Bryobacteraceae bacterium]